jgi:hypothetical protein
MATHREHLISPRAKSACIVVALLAVALLVGAFTLTGSGAAKAAGAVAADVNPNPVAAGPVHKGNILCARDGDRLLSMFDHQCPTGFHYAQIDSTDVFDRGGKVGATSPAASPVASGAVVIKHAKVDLDVNSPASQTVVVSGLPAFKASLPQLVTTNADATPAGTTITVTPLATATGSTSRSFTVAVSGFTGTQHFTLDIAALVIDPSA